MKDQADLRTRNVLCVSRHPYDQVIHYRCCEPAAFNVGNNEEVQQVSFHTLRFTPLR